MKHHGLNEDALQSVFRGRILSKLLYCAPAWWGFVNQSIKMQLEQFLKRVTRFNYSSENGPNFETLVKQLEVSLFKSVITNPSHCLFPLFPPPKSITYGLRPRGHGYTLPPKDCRNFINRCLYELK